ncbi:hypothetical protein DSO57_1024125 [Entomophthora muscae]|uniref:Uncharacterized protein n=1 Tax=Entomophthora muscae TaxID=34485 RepID=A0ACC2SRL0_9FUNG|nr:hypothetical protein DSO57_1024125 [Entomophthora muscae]
MTASHNNYSQFVVFQQWAHNLLTLLSANQCDSFMLQQHLQSTVDTFVLSFSIVYVTTFWHIKLAKLLDRIIGSLGNFFCLIIPGSYSNCASEWVVESQRLKYYIKENLRSESCKSSTPPASDPNSELQEILEAIPELKATTRHQVTSVASTPPPSAPDSQITVLIRQMTGQRAEAEALCAAVTSTDGTHPPVEEEGCCPGNKGEPWTKCSALIDNLIQDVDGVVHNCKILNTDLQV